jgi:hypothetical protein
MRHDWIFDVLTDLHSYAEANSLTEVARAVDAAIVVARREIGSEGDGGPDGGRRRSGPKRGSH